ncbi:MAG: hypothetical protein LBJ00_02710 [Planctomycetaceae bacterium]|nr:hypothetical protein [Planctomycetaceae bacterium]
MITNIIGRLRVLVNMIYSGCFKIPEATVNLQRRALGKRNNVKRLFKGEAYRLTSYGMEFCPFEFG